MKKASPPKKTSPQITQANGIKLCPRLQRLAEALLRRPHSTRELIDTIPATNPAEYVRQLRRDHGLIVLCERVKCVTLDGAQSWYGRYHLPASEHEKLRGALGV